MSFDTNKQLHMIAIAFGIVIVILDFIEFVFDYRTASFIKEMFVLLSVVWFLLYYVIKSIEVPLVPKEHMYLVYKELPKSKKSLTADEYKVLQFIQAQQIPYIIRKDVETILQYKKSKSKLVVRSLIDHECLTKIGTGRYIRYLVNKEVIDVLLQNNTNVE